MSFDPSSLLEKFRSQLRGMEGSGDIRRCAVSAEDLDRQLAEFRRKMHRRNNSIGADRYLATYDGCMRIVEYLLLREGFRFGDSPHRAFRTGVVALLGMVDAKEIQLLTTARHGVKKSGLPLEPSRAQKLDEVLEEFRALAKACGIPLGDS